MNKLVLLLLLAAGCYRVSDSIHPCIDYQIQDRHFAKLNSAFPPLNATERSTDWGREMIIAKAFAEQLDLYRAISTYKRAEILVPTMDHQRKLEIQYDMLLCYFLANRYDEVIFAFDQSGLANVDKTFPAYHDLLLILYESYRELDCLEQQEKVLELMRNTYPETAEKVQISASLRTGDLPTIRQYAQGFSERSYLDDLLDCYETQKKSVATAQTLNAFLPGAGYLYIGQKSSALTAFLLNSLFIVAAYEFFHHGHTAAGIITTLFESGWYFGGIYGVGLETKYYNEKIYARNASCVLNQKNLFPVLMIQYDF